MKDRKKVYRRCLILATIFSLIFTIIYSSNQYINLYIPDEIKLMEGRIENFDFNINMPLEAKITSEKQGVVSVNESNVPQDQINISLNESFTIQSNEVNEMTANVKLFGIIPIKEVKVDVIPQTEIIPAGLTVGVIVSTEGVMVLGTGEVKGDDGISYEPATGILKSGDYITKADNNTIQSKEELVEYINEKGDGEINFTIKRDGQEQNVNITPIESNGSYKLGIWVRDDTQGIGTVTYVDPISKTFGALGHGITDADTKQLINILEGDLLETKITSITKGQKGFPGEISGMIINDSKNKLGTVSKNTEYGIFGDVEETIYNYIEKEPLAIGLKHEVEVGPAIIKSCVDDTIREYQIEITKVFLGNNDVNKGMIIEVVDENLIDKTNGIVQGMSGSPIVQNDKIIGAVTHVFVQDSTKGYGTFIENMLNASNQ
ncbi:stage IV sporulation protein B [Natranaerovirga hydrolytica]|uniref:Stage IV sporulation protein B n=1 Tax=Natranaerovirga hydrolytica TaxID=680378 RepID=A0A4R1MYH3_9FIRM|nr:SpoIVB peptidase [Natranaerovirga hydrolytica]TCK98348.1 stage IV sporulation protein B [Natranaerovirga hydrolytica]